MAAGLGPAAAGPGGGDLPSWSSCSSSWWPSSPRCSPPSPATGSTSSSAPPVSRPTACPSVPDRTFLLGTDDQGRDILVRIAYGARISLFVGVVATLLTVAIGAMLGLAAGYLGGIVDTIIARLIDLVLSLPYLLFAISLVSISHPGLTIVDHRHRPLRLGRGGPDRARPGAVDPGEGVRRGGPLARGRAPWRIMFVDILPNVIAQLIVYATLLIPVTIVAEATLSFLGLGIPPPTADWGQMLAEAQSVYQQAWWFLVFPSLALLITTLAFNIFGDGVRDALDPRFEQRFLGARGGPVPHPPNPARDLRDVDGHGLGLRVSSSSAPAPTTWPGSSPAGRTPADRRR